MTIDNFVHQLAEEAERILKDISFINVKKQQVPIKGYPYELPLAMIRAGWGEGEEIGSEEELFPYILVQISDIDYEEEEALAKVWILMGVYDEDPQMSGWTNITAAVERLVNRFRVNSVLMDYYYCDRQMKVAYPEQGDWPHFFAGIEMTWHLPVLEPNL